MEKDKGLERLYELIENFDFDELSEFEKAIVLNHISEEEYKNMRGTITDTRDLFDKIPVESNIEHKSGFRTLLNYQIEIYKVAASIILLMGIGIILSKSIFPKQSELLSMVDTVFVERVDTLLIEKWDTIEVIREKVVIREQHNEPTIDVVAQISFEESTAKTDCSKMLCPEDIAQFSKIKTKGSISKDTLLSDFIVTIN